MTCAQHSESLEHSFEIPNPFIQYYKAGFGWSVFVVKGKGLVINYRDGRLQNGRIVGPKLFCNPLPHKTG